jgi:DNA polymerase III delta subunit
MKFLYGSEKYLIHQKLMELKRDFKNENPNADLVVFDLDDEDLKTVKDSLLQTQGLFSTQKMIVFQNVLNLKKFGQDGLQEFLKEKKLCKDKNLKIIFAETNEKGSKSASTKLGQYLKRNGEKIEFKKMTDDQLRQWVNSEFLKRSERKVTDEMMATRELISLTRGNLWQLSNEIDKLIIYKEFGDVKVEDVRDLCSGKVEAKIFDLVDAIGANNKKRALLLKQQLIDQGDNEFYIFTMILFQIRNLLKVSECLQRGINNSFEIKKQTGLHPFVIQKTIGNLNYFSSEKIKQIYQMIAEIDKRTKTGGMEMTKAIDWLIIRM